MNEFIIMYLIFGFPTVGWIVTRGYTVYDTYFSCWLSGMIAHVASAVVLAIAIAVWNISFTLFG